MVKKFGLLIGIFAAIATVGLVVRHILVGDSSITFRIANTSELVVSSLTIEVAGNKRILGTLHPGQSQVITMTPRNQAGGVAITFTLPDGSKRADVLSGYVESKNFRSRIQVEIRENGAIEVTSNTVSVAPW